VSALLAVAAAQFLPYSGYGYSGYPYGRYGYNYAGPGAGAAADHDEAYPAAAEMMSSAGALPSGGLPTQQEEVAAAAADNPTGAEQAATGLTPPGGHPPTDDPAASLLVVRPYPLETLRKMSDAELSAIDEFEVSLPGYGTLRWPGRTDVRDVLPHLGRVIQFEKRRVHVYSKGPVEKPPPDHGLNKPCIYTMEDVFTKERSTGEYLTDAKSVTAFRAQLQRSADKNGGKMLGYDPQRGEWTIEVPHF